MSPVSGSKVPSITISMFGAEISASLIISLAELIMQRVDCSRLSPEIEQFNGSP